jgi:hypothetical protein
MIAEPLAGKLSIYRSDSTCDLSTQTADRKAGGTEGREWRGC